MHRLEAEVCGGCGKSRHESMAPGTEFGWKVEALRCHACATKERTAKMHQEQEMDTSGINYIVSKD